MDAVALGGCRVHLMADVRGLASESERVRTAFEEIRPDAVAVSLGREELEALKGYSGGNARQGKLRKWVSEAGTAADFVREWDALVNASAGYRKLVGERESFLARRLRQLAPRYGILLALVDVERADGVLRQLA